MSGQKMIFAFKDDLNLTLDKEKVAKEGVINFHLDFGQVNVDYEGRLMNVVSHREAEGLKSVMRTSSKKGESSKRRKAREVSETHDSTERVKQIPSMVLTPTGELVDASSGRALEVIQKDRVPLRRTQHRNANRRKLRLRKRLERQAREAIAEPILATEEQIHVQPRGQIQIQSPKKIKYSR